MARDSRGAWALALALGWAGGCDDVPAADQAEEVEPAAVEPIWSGCVLTGEGRRCQLYRPPLVVWLPESDPSWIWAFDDEQMDPVQEDADDGVRFTFDPSMYEDGGHTVALWDAGGESPLFTLDLVPDPIHASNFGFAADVEAALESPSAPARLEAAERLLARPSPSEVEKLARIHYARLLTYIEADPIGSSKSVLALLEREDRMSAEGDFWGVRCSGAMTGMFWGTLLEEPEVVRRWGLLEGQCRGRSAEVAAGFDHYLGKQALYEGAYAEAEARLSNARDIATRVLATRRIQASKELMDLYVRTGRWSEAGREIESLQALLPLGTCDRADAESSIGFVRIRAQQSNNANLGDPSPGLELALQKHAAQGECPNVAFHIHDLVKLGYAAELRGDTTALRGYVERLSTEPLFGKYRHQMGELQLLLAVAEKRFPEVPALASAMDDLLGDSEPEAQWRRQMILAEAATAQGNNAAAQQAHLAAEVVLDELWAGVSSNALRARWLSAYRRSAVGLMRLRLDVQDLEGAACAARSARLRALDPGDDSGITDERCRRTWARAQNEVVFLIVPETDDDWTVFVIQEERVVEATRVRAPDRGATLEWWSPWTDAIRLAGRVRILASGVALRAPMHQLPWQGEPLIQQRPVTFGLDLDPLQTQRAAPVPAASVVFADADPYRALGRYAPDLREAQHGLERGGWSPRWLESSGGTLAMADAVTPGGLLVYYGHGERVDLSQSASLGSADDVGTTALLLDHDVHWGVEDVLALGQVPRWAVLLGCDVAFPDVESWSGGLNLAHALLLGGTHQVLAATGPVDANAAARLAAPLLAAEASEKLDLSEALHRVWARASDSDPMSGLGALRVWSR